MGSCRDTRPGGRRPRGPRSFSRGASPGLQPFDNYPIHIIVKNGRTTLMGAEILDVFSIENELVIDSGLTARTRSLLHEQRQAAYFLAASEQQHLDPMRVNALFTRRPRKHRKPTVL
jgi:hypothetical protein